MEIVGRSKQGYPTLRVYVQPRASRTACCGLSDHGLKLMVSAPPVDGKANRAVRDYLADLFKVRRNTIVLASGEHGRQKTFLFTSLSESTLAERLDSLL